MDPHAPLNTNSPLEQPLQDAIKLFTALNIPYALIGSITAMTYTGGKFSENLDFVVGANYQEALAANPDVMRSCNFDTASARKLHHSTGFEIDIWENADSDAIAARARTVRFGDQDLRVAEPHDLIATLLLAKRAQDNYDISEILKHVSIDEALLQSRVTSEQFVHYQSIKARR